MKASMGEAFADAQLRNVVDMTGDCFDPVALQTAFETYDVFKQTTDLTLPDRTWLSIDPSGTGHAWGWFIGGLKNRTLFEIESGTLQMGTGKDGHSVSPQTLNEFLLSKAKQWAVHTVVCESNTGGPAVQIYLQQHGRNVVSQNFGADGATNSRFAFIHLARKLIDQQQIVLANRDLYRQLIIYNPSKGSADKLKGDLADAFLHFCWIAGGGLQAFETSQIRATPSRVVW
jgi:hypothetical protein